MNAAIPPHLSVRPLACDDLANYHALRLRGLEECPEAFGESAAHFRTTTVSELANRFHCSADRGGFTLGAFDGQERPFGVVSIGRLSGEKMEHRLGLWGMYVSPEYRGQGIGRRLAIGAIGRARALPDAEQIHLAVVTSNTPAVGLYRSLGFAIYGRDPRVLKVGSKYHDEYLMLLDLAP